jgi:predicted kinase
VLTGPPCSGKSTLGRMLALRVGAVWLDIDEVRQEILPASHQSLADRDTAYRCIHLTAGKLVEAKGRPIVLAATYGRRQSRIGLVTLIEQTQVDIGLFQCTIDPDAAAARFRNRPAGHAAVDLSEEAVRRQASSYAYGGATPIQTHDRVGLSLDRIERALAAYPPLDLMAWVQGAPESCNRVGMPESGNRVIE